MAHCAWGGGGAARSGLSQKTWRHRRSREVAPTQPAEQTEPSQQVTAEVEIANNRRNPDVAKNMVFDDDARQPLKAGVQKLARAVRSTLGPRGRNAVLDKRWGSPKITKDGVTVAEEI